MKKPMASCNTHIIKQQMIEHHLNMFSLHYNADRTCNNKPVNRKMRRLHIAACELHHAAADRYMEDDMKNGDFFGDMASKLTSKIESIKLK